MVDFKTDKRSLLVKAINGSDTVQGLLFTRLPGYLTTMSKANLDPVSSRSTCGPLLVMCAVIGSCYCMPMCVPAWHCCFVCIGCGGCMPWSPVGVYHYFGGSVY